MTRWRPTLGIDFGTSNTSAAWCDQRGRVQSVMVTNVDHTVPSAIWFSSPAKYVVGAAARQQILTDPTNTVFGFKRFVGRSTRSEFVNSIRDRFPYKIVEDDEGMVAVEVHGTMIPMVKLISFVFQRMQELAQADTAERFERCVLSVPSHYTYRQRQVLRTAAEMAGLEVRALLNEPTAAALYLSKQTPMQGKALIFDLGGGTFDATLISVEGYLVKILASGGDAFLGGNDFDERIARELARKFESEHDVEIQGKKVVMLRLMFAAEMAKIMLSQVDSAPVRVIYAAERWGRPLDLNYTLTRDALASLVAPLVERCIGACEDVLRNAGVRPTDVSEVILVGGQTRTPILRNRLYGMFKGNPNRNPNPELSVSTGAALLGRMLDMPAGPALVDVCSIPLWAMGPGLAPQVVVPAGAAIPHTHRVPLPAPTPSTPMIVFLYEALEATSLERDMVASVRLEPDFIAAHPGPVTLEVTMNQSFTLETTVVAADGHRQTLPLQPPRAPRR